MSAATSTIDGVVVTHARVVELEASLATSLARCAEWELKHDRLLGAYQALQQQLELIRRRLFDAKAERIDTTQLELEFAEKLAALDALSGQLVPPPAGSAGGTSGNGATPAADGNANGEGPKPARPDNGKPPRPSPKGRRDLRDLDLPEERVVLDDPTLEGTAVKIGTEESRRLMWRRAGYVRLVTVRAKYRPVQVVESISPEIAVPVTEAPMTDMAPAPSVTVEPPLPTIVTAPLPPEMINRSFGTPSLWAHIVNDKLCYGLPLHRQEDRFAWLGFRIDRGTMCRWMEDLGMTVGASVVQAMRDEAMRTAFCIATDATGILVQPIRTGDKQRRSCKHGHYFVLIADADHVFFEYTEKETSATVTEMFRGFTGYLQADAKSVYNFLYRSLDQRPISDDGTPDDDPVCFEVGCWSHLRTKVWEAAVVTKDPVAREGLARIGRIFALDRSWKDRPPDEIKALREAHLRPHVDAFFEFVATEYERVRDQRGLLRTALGYALRQQGALTRFFDDGRLKLTNNGSERELRRIATGRKAWLFVGSDDHAQAAGNLLTLIASARLHKIDPEAYLRDLFRVLPQWPLDRNIELAPKYWLATRARMDPAELAVEVGWLTIPPRLPPQE